MSLIETHSYVCPPFKVFFDEAIGVGYGVYALNKVGYFFQLSMDNKMVPFTFCPFCGRKVF